MSGIEQILAGVGGFILVILLAFLVGYANNITTGGPKNRWYIVRWLLVPIIWGPEGILYIIVQAGEIGDSLWHRGKLAALVKVVQQGRDDHNNRERREQQIQAVTADVTTPS